MTLTYRFSRWAFGLISLMALIATGCTPVDKLVPVEGVVLIDGKPAPNISVQFMPDVLKGGQGPTSFGTTDAEGKFTLTTNDGKAGAVIGPHIVTLVDNDEERPEQGTEATKLPRLHPRYTTTMGGIPVEVKGDNQPIKLEVPKFRG